MAQKVTIEGSNKLETVNDDWGGVNNSPSTIVVYNTPVPSGAEWGMNRGEVERFAKQTWNQKAGEFYYDADNARYLVFADAASRDLYLSDRDRYASLVLGTFDAPANYTAEITVYSQTNNTILAGQIGNYITFTFDVKNRSGASTGESVVATIVFNNAGNRQTVTQVYSAGTTVNFLADSYLANGVNSVSITITGRTSLASTTTAVFYTVVDIQLTSTFDFSVPVAVDPNNNNRAYLNVPYRLRGAGLKYLEWYIDGVTFGQTDSITDTDVTRIKAMDVTALSAGKHNVQFRAYITSDGTNFYSKTLYFDFYYSKGEVATAILHGLTIDEPTDESPSISIEQFETFNYQLAIYDSQSRVITVTIADNGTTIQSLAVQPQDREDMSYTPETEGTHTLAFTAEGQTVSIEFDVSENDIGIKEAEDQLVLKLSAKGRSNSEVNPAQWTYGNITTTFSGFNWNENSGWNGKALVIPSGASITIDFKPLLTSPLAAGRTIEIDYATDNVDDEDSDILVLNNATTNAGLSITASTASLQSSGGANVNTKFGSGERNHITFIINRTDGDNAGLMFIVNNGILERAAAYQPTDSFIVDNTMTIGSTGCTVKIYGIRVYNRNLLVDEAFGNYAFDSDNIIQIANRNDIFDTLGNIDADKVNAQLPIIIITGDMRPIFNTTDKNTKVYVDMEYRNLQDPTKSFTATHVKMKPQGTSSLGYPRKNLRPYTSAADGCVMLDYAGDVIPDGKYAFKDGSQPVNCWTLKADYAESSGSHNTGVARIWNELMYNAMVDGAYPLRTQAQVAAKANNYPYDVRTTVDGFPIVVFWRLTENTPLTCLGQYNFNNDKSTESVFGFCDIPGFVDTNVQCFEFLENENPLCLFTDVSNFDSDWDTAWESRYPDTKTPNLTPLKTLATWINSCMGENGQEEWNAHKADHFDLPKLAAYYVYLMRFGAVDQTVKNAMITTEDGIHWYFINYDNDTVMGIDNVSTVLNMWNYDRQSTYGNMYVYAGHNSVLWNCFEEDDECMTLVSKIDTALYSAGLRYENLLGMFDNEQTDKWCERIYNDNGVYKYIEPYFTSGASVLYMLQGSRKSYRHWWLGHRMQMCDAMWGGGTFQARNFRFVAPSAPADTTFTLRSAIDTYYGYGINAVPQKMGEHANKNGTVTFQISRALAIGDPVYIYNANNMSELDISNFAFNLRTILMTYMDGTMEGQEDTPTGVSISLKKLILGNGTDTNSSLEEIGSLVKATALEELDIRGFTAMRVVNLSTLNNLHVFKASGSGLTSFAPAVGVTLTNVSLPSSINAIVLDGASVSSLTYTATTTLTTLTLKNVTGSWNAQSFTFGWLNLLSDAQLAERNVTLWGINWTGVTAAQAIMLGKVYEAGNADLRGKITLSSMTQAQFETLVGLYGEDVFRAGGAFMIDAPSGFYIAGPTTIKQGNSETYIAASFPATDTPIKYILYNDTTQIPPQTDSQGRVYRTYNGVTLYEASGVASAATGLPSAVTVRIRARLGSAETYTDYITLNVPAIVYPNIIITGAANIDHNADYNYTMTFQSSAEIPDVQSVAWSLTENNACSITQSDDNGATITVTNTPATALSVTLTCTVTFTDGYVRTGTKSISLQLTFPTSVTITGDSTISAVGTYDYEKTLVGEYTASVSQVDWILASTNPAITISSSTANGATVNVGGANESQITITLTCTVTFTGNVTRTGAKSISVSVIEPPITEEWIDFGLPSGVLYRSWNLGATGAYEQGLYYAWGELQGYHSAAERNAALGFTSGFSQEAYNVGSAASISANLTKEQDAANAALGGYIRMPSLAEVDELRANADFTTTTINGVQYFKVMKRTDHSVFMLFPSGGYSGMTLDTNAFFWTNTYYSSAFAYYAYITSNTFNRTNNRRFWGYPIRPVKDEPRAIDLGLSVKWADRNIGMFTKTDKNALYFSWGNTAGHDSSYNFSQANYEGTTGSSLVASLSLANDAAHVMWGGKWRMPTKDEIQELIDDTNHSYGMVSGFVYCGTFTNKNDSSKYITIPEFNILTNTSNSRSVAIQSSELLPNNSNYCYIMAMNYSGTVTVYNTARYSGVPIRAVYDPTIP